MRESREVSLVMIDQKTSQVPMLHDLNRTLHWYTKMFKWFACLFHWNLTEIITQYHIRATPAQLERMNENHHKWQADTI